VIFFSHALRPCVAGEWSVKLFHILHWHLLRSLKTLNFVSCIIEHGWISQGVVWCFAFSQHVARYEHQRDRGGGQTLGMSIVTRGLPLLQLDRASLCVFVWLNAFS